MKYNYIDLLLYQQIKIIFPNQTVDTRAIFQYPFFSRQARFFQVTKVVFKERAKRKKKAENWTVSLGSKGSENLSPNHKKKN